MKYYSCLFWIFISCSSSLFSQEKFSQHTVAKGETISQIAQKYLVSPAAIYELNPDAVNGIKRNTVLLIPTSSKTISSVTSIERNRNLEAISHEVSAKETVYGIAKHYQIAIEDLYNENPSLVKEGLKIGQLIKVPPTDKNKKSLHKLQEFKDEKKLLVTQTNEVSQGTNSQLERETKDSNLGTSYEVMPKESLFAIARKFNIKLSDLQNANPQLTNTRLQAGQKINIPTKGVVIETGSSEKKYYNEKVKNESVIKQERQDDLKEITTERLRENSNSIQTHEVIRGESLFAISKKYGISVSEIQKINPELVGKSIKVGQKINVPVLIKSNLNQLSDSDNNQNSAQSANEVTINKQLSQIQENQKKVFEIKETEAEISHQVLPKETKYGIAKQYGLTVAELEKQNPTIVNQLLVGVLLKIRSSVALEKSISDQPVIHSIETFKTDSRTTPIIEHDAVFIDQLINRASENMGTPYRSGGTTKDGFDCSGLMYYTFANCDIKLPRSSAEMAAYGSKIETENAQKGDLIFFKTRGSSRINHVGMVVEVHEGEIKFIHSATHGGVIISSTKESYYGKNLVQVNRVL